MGSSSKFGTSSCRGTSYTSPNTRIDSRLSQHAENANRPKATCTQSPRASCALPSCALRGRHWHQCLRRLDGVKNASISVDAAQQLQNPAPGSRSLSPAIVYDELIGFQVARSGSPEAAIAQKLTDHALYDVNQALLIVSFTAMIERYQELRGGLETNCD
jgi:hypothetical protein